METVEAAAAPSETPPDRTSNAHWRETVRKYERSSTAANVGQIMMSIVPYIALCAAMYMLMSISWLAVCLLWIPAAAFLVRTFIVFHDCGHKSMFKSQRMNTLVGRVCGVLVYTPFSQWRHEHAIHHATAGDLTRRGTGDITTWTIDEYRSNGWRARVRYRIYRNPIVLFVIGGAWFHLIQQRIPAKEARRRDKNSVHLTSIACALMTAATCWLLGWEFVAFVQLPTLAVAASAGVWLFYVQHQFEDAYWASGGEWSYADAALRGSSYLKLPRILQWSTGNIGVHHVHHLSSRIPNYRLQQCHDENPELFGTVPTLSTAQAFGTMRLKLWDSENQRMVGWKALQTPAT
jgi:omega-6 fatty acid desaturase (delta-12 desaturase)